MKDDATAFLADPGLHRSCLRNRSSKQTGWRIHRSIGRFDMPRARQVQTRVSCVKQLDRVHLTLTVGAGTFLVRHDDRALIGIVDRRFTTSPSQMP